LGDGVGDLGLFAAFGFSDSSRMKDTATTLEIQAQSALFVGNGDGGLPVEIVYMPKGKSTLTPMVDGKPSPIELEVTPEVVDVLQAALADRLAENVRPHADFDHKPRPVAFFLKKLRGTTQESIVLNVNWMVCGAGLAACSCNFRISTHVFPIVRRAGKLEIFRGDLWQPIVWIAPMSAVTSWCRESFSI
jgi:hypothetical protein